LRSNCASSASAPRPADRAGAGPGRCSGCLAPDQSSNRSPARLQAPESDCRRRRMRQSERTCRVRSSTPGYTSRCCSIRGMASAPTAAKRAPYLEVVDVTGRDRWPRGRTGRSVSRNNCAIPRCAKSSRPAQRRAKSYRSGGNRLCYGSRGGGSPTGHAICTSAARAAATPPSDLPEAASAIEELFRW
jgi:hypothetical protein